MEQVRWRGHVGDLHVTVLVETIQLLGAWVDAGLLVGELEVTLHTAGRVLGSLSVISVGKGHDKSRSLHPLDFSGSDELINDTLSIVGEVTELSLPHNEGVW